jgi:hypothetical protein
VPELLFAVIVKVYSVPLVKPLTVIGLFIPVACSPVGTPLDRTVTVYPVMPVLPDGGSKNSRACAFPALANLITGADGPEVLAALSEETVTLVCGDVAADPATTIPVVDGVWTTAVGGLESAGAFAVRAAGIGTAGAISLAGADTGPGGKGATIPAAAVRLTAVLPAAGDARAGTGAIGTASAIALLGAEGLPVPALLVAVTVNVYLLPLVSPVTVTGLAVPLAVIPPGLAVTVYVVMVRSLLGAVKLTDA